MNENTCGVTVIFDQVILLLLLYQVKRVLMLVINSGGSLLELALVIQESY